MVFVLCRGVVKRAQFGAVALDHREDANAVVLDGDIMAVQIEEIRKADTDMPDIVCN